METKEKNFPEIFIEGNSNIYYEEPDNFEKSIQKDVYINAFQITKEIVRSVNRTKEHTSGTEQRNKEQVYNIVFFTGERGSGKTSTMLSYMEYLKDYYRKTTSKAEKSIIKELKFKKASCIL